MKLSDAILKGMERFPVQMRHRFFDRCGNYACVMGCAMWASGGNKCLNDPQARELAWRPFDRADAHFAQEYGATISSLNDEGFSREDIVGMLKAINE